MINARGAIPNLAERNVEIVRELHRRALDGMTEADLANRGISRRDRPCIDRHRVDVLQQDRIWTDREHVLTDRPEMRHGSKAAHDAADAQRIGDRLPEAEALGDLEMRYRAGSVAADLERRDHEIR